MVMLSCITIIKLLHQTIAVETSYLILNMCYVRRVQNNCAVSKTIAQLFTISMISSSIQCAQLLNALFFTLNAKKTVVLEVNCRS